MGICRNCERWKHAEGDSGWCDVHYEAKTEENFCEDFELKSENKLFKHLEIKDNK